MSDVQAPTAGQADPALSSSSPSSATASAAASAASYLRAHGLVVVTAESCTAGLIASRLAEVPGAGEVVDTAFVVYDPKAQQRCLDVKAATLERCNLTSEAVAREMAQGALARSAANVAIANTGVADDSDPDVPVGTQCFVWAFRHGTSVRTFTETKRFDGERSAIREAAADHALRRIAHHHARLTAT